MAFIDDLTSETVKILKATWTPREGGKQVPEAEQVKLGNDAVTLKGTVLYADLADSTGLVEKGPPSFAAEVYKVYLNSACRIIRERGGVVTAFDGDRVMAVFLGDSKNTQAMTAALQINYVVTTILTPKIRAAYPNHAQFVLKQAVAIDTSDLFVAKTGIRGSNDLVWVGTAANKAAKLCGIRDGDSLSVAWITQAVLDGAQDSAKVSGGKSMWEARSWTARQNERIYRSTATIKP